MGAALLGFFVGLGRVGGGSFLRTGAPSLSGIGARVGGGTSSWLESLGSSWTVSESLLAIESRLPGLAGARAAPKGSK